MRQLIAIVCFVALAGPSLAQSRAWTLGEARSPSDLSPAAVDAREILDWQSLGAATSTIEVDVPDGRRFFLERAGGEARGGNDFVWRGRDAALGLDMTLTRANGVLVGRLSSPDESWEIGTISDGTQVIAALDASRYAPCASEPGTDPLVRPATTSRSVEDTPTVVSRGPAVPIGIDVMVTYTPQARDAAGGVSQIEALAQGSVDLSNTAYANSEIDVELRLVHTTLVNHNDTGNISTDLNWLNGDPTVQGLRDEHAADMVGLLVNNGGGFCGVARLLGNEDPVAFEDRAYQVTARTCAVGNLSYPHEHGHNFGAQHNPENGAPPSQAIFDYAYGHYHNGQYRTVMSYSNPCASGCTRQPYFSNPNVDFMALPTGIVDQRENWRTHNNIAPYTAAYRNGEEVFTDGFESGDVSVWSTTSP